MTPKDLRAAPVVALDLETTGYSADHDRAIEIAALRYQGDTLVDSLQSLLNPGVPVPPRIQRLTGITDVMLHDAPRLEDVLFRIMGLLNGAVLIVHNLAFDFGFLRRAAAAQRVEIEGARVCTLKLARRVTPNLPSYRLDRLARALGLPPLSGGRAWSHAEQTVALYRYLLVHADDATLRSCLETGVRSDRAPREPELWRGVPSCPGVYMLKDARGRVLYVGKSTSLRRRVREHLRQRWHPQPGLRRQLKRVRSVDVIETDTDLEALFMEARLIKQYQPNGNSADRLERFVAYLMVDRRGDYPSFRVTDTEGAEAECVFGPFGSRNLLEAGVRALADAVGLCASGDPARCRPLIPRHCLGPCGLNGNASQYCDALDSALALLRGEDQRLLDSLRRRRDHEADGLHFEAAAALRDRIIALERLVGDERWRRDVRSVNVILILPAERAELRKLVCIRKNRLAATHRVSIDVTFEVLEATLSATYLTHDLPPASGNEMSEEMRLVHQWLRRARDRHPVIPVDPQHLSKVAEAVVTRLQNLQTASLVR